MVTFVRISGQDSLAVTADRPPQGPLPIKEILPQVLARYAFLHQPTPAAAASPVIQNRLTAHFAGAQRLVVGES